jgi:hypothetical protein
MLSLFVSTIVFVVSAWFFHRYLEKQGIPKGMVRGVLVFAFAFLLSSLAAKLLDRGAIVEHVVKPPVQRAID